jgi:hypothetical protein
MRKLTRASLYVQERGEGTFRSSEPEPGRTFRDRDEELLAEVFVRREPTRDVELFSARKGKRGEKAKRRKVSSRRQHAG